MELDLSQSVDCVADQLEVHRSAVKQSAVNLLGTPLRDQPDLDLVAPPGYVLKEYKHVPKLTKATTQTDLNVLDALIDVAVAKAEAMADEDADQLEDTLLAALELPTIKALRADLQRNGLPWYSRG